jgi:hypothetical protein
MRISRRMAGLLDKAAQCFGAGRSPFHDQAWLLDNEVTPAECAQLADLIGAALQGFTRSPDRAQFDVQPNDASNHPSFR